MGNSRARRLFRRAHPLADSSRALSFADPRAVHVWAAPLDLPTPRLARLESLLSDDERERAATFRSEALQRQFISARGQVREILARYVARDPRPLRFVYDEHRRPALRPDFLNARVEFNISHSRRVVLLAVSSGVRLGVDVEEVKTFDDMAGVATHFFSAAERQELALAPASDYARAFYRCWTRKEAYLKAIGTGLFTPLDSFDVSLDERSPRLLRVANRLEAPDQWTIHHLAPDDDHLGAPAIAVARPVILCWAFAC